MNPVYSLLTDRIAAIDAALDEVKSAIKDALDEEAAWRKQNRIPEKARVAPIPASVSEIVPLAEVERQAILNAMRASNSNAKQAARDLGIGFSTIFRKLKQYRKEALQ